MNLDLALSLSHAELLVISLLLLTFTLIFAFYNRRLKKALALAESAKRARANFLATVSHEIRTPLNAVIGFAEFLRSPDLKTSDVAAYAENIDKASRILLDLINDVLDLSKLDAGRADVRKGVLDLRRLVDDMTSVFAAKAAAKGVKLSFSLPSDVDGLALSPQHFRQVLLNLIGNAVKFTDRGSIVTTVTLEPRGHSVTDLLIEVADTGCGISREALPTVFNPFVQDIATRGGRIYEGTGLGLPIVRRIVENAGGTVNVSSEVGKGTTFRLRIPDVRCVSLARKTDTTVTSDVRPPASVILVDDVPMNLRVLSLHLEKLGVHDIRQAASGKEALALFAERPAELVLTDMWMPGMDGTELARRLRVCGSHPELRVVAVTADAGTATTFDMSPFTAVVTKPVTQEKLRVAFEMS